MQRVLTGKIAKQVDSYCTKIIGIPSLVLMERAAIAVVNEVLKESNNDLRIGIFCGTGNNGADGLAIGRILQGKYLIDIYIIGERNKGTDEFKTQLTILKNMGIEPIYIEDEIELSEHNLNSYSVLIDAIFGIGLSRELTGKYAQIVELIDKSPGYKIAVDIPSGLCADTGRVMGNAICADKTVTFGTLKTGLLLCEARNYTGEIVVTDIGFPEFVYKKMEQQYNSISYAYENKDLWNLPKRKKASNKGTFGKVFLIAGSETMCGAAYLAAKAAYRMGVGLVEIFTHTNNLSVLKGMLPEAIIINYEDTGFDELKKELNIYNRKVIVMGPGLSVTDQSCSLVEEVLKNVSKNELGYVSQSSSKNAIGNSSENVSENTSKNLCSLVIDADGLNIMAEHRNLLKYLNENIVITPHIKEMSRLLQVDTSYVAEHLIQCASEFSEKYHCVTVLKDSSTVITNQLGNVIINTSGNSGMATGGSGDVLSGIIGGLLSYKLPIYEAASLGVYLHGLAGNEATSVKTEYSMLASDIVEAIPKVIRQREDKKNG